MHKANTQAEVHAYGLGRDTVGSEGAAAIAEETGMPLERTEHSMDVFYLVHESTGKFQLGAELDQGLLENQVLCMVHMCVKIMCQVTRRPLYCLQQGCILRAFNLQHDEVEGTGKDTMDSKGCTLPPQASRPTQAAMTSAAASSNASSSACIADNVKQREVCSTGQTQRSLCSNKQPVSPVVDSTLVNLDTAPACLA